MMLRAGARGVMISVRVQPGAKNNCIGGVYGEGAAERLKISLKVPAIEGRANQALIAFLAEIFSVNRGAIELVSGALSRRRF
jgi:uncharacterized protein